MKRSPVNRDRNTRLKQRGRLGRTRRVEVSRAERRAPAGDGQKRDIDRRQARHLGEEVGVACEVHRGALSDHKADRLGPGAADRPPGRRMDGAHRLDAKPADLGPLSLLQLLDLESGSAQQFARAPGRHEPRPGAETAERRDVEVIVMEVRDENGVEVPWHLRWRAVATEMRYSRAKDGVGEKAHATELYEHGGVADVRDASRRYVVAPTPRASSACWSCASCSFDRELWIT